MRAYFGFVALFMAAIRPEALKEADQGAVELLRLLHARQMRGARNHDRIVMTEGPGQQIRRLTAIWQIVLADHDQRRSRDLVPPLGPGWVEGDE